MMENSSVHRKNAPSPNDLRLDELDEGILWELSRDARLTNSAIAAKLGVAPSTALARTKALVQRGILRGSHAAIDLPAVGLPIQAVIAVRLRAQARGELRSYAKKIVRLPQVLSVYFLGGPDDFLIHLACTSPEQLRDFVATQLSTDSAVASTQTNLVFDYIDAHDYPGAGGGFKAARSRLS